MVTIVKKMTIGIRPQYSKELDKLLNQLGLFPTKTEFYETKVMEHRLCGYYVEVLCNEYEEEKLLYCLNNEFKYNVTVKY